MDDKMHNINTSKMKNYYNVKMNLCYLLVLQPNLRWALAVNKSKVTKEILVEIKDFFYWRSLEKYSETKTRRYEKRREEKKEEERRGEEKHTK